MYVFIYHLKAIIKILSNLLLGMSTCVHCSHSNLDLSSKWGFMQSWKVLNFFKAQALFSPYDLLDSASNVIIFT